jgi:integrase
MRQKSGKMDFLSSCASRLDEGCPAEEVLSDMKERYKTVRCLSVKTCLVRKMCRPSEEYVKAVERACEENPQWSDKIRRGKADGEEGVVEVLRSLPRRLDENVRRLCVTRSEMMECKREGARSAIRKNVRRIKVEGRSLLKEARRLLQHLFEEEGKEEGKAKRERISSASFAIMLVTGRRTCEILNGSSVFEKEGERSLLFTGMAKQRGNAPPIVLPVLAPPSHILSAIRWVRERQTGSVLTNRETSLRYQSLLGREMASDTLWKQCGRVHGLRGIYACMCVRLFDWGDCTDAYVSMCILGHSGLKESLVYTTYHLGDDFSQESMLGEGRLTHHASFDFES